MSFMLISVQGVPSLWKKVIPFEGETIFVKITSPFLPAGD
jgi:hypothetical protein